MKLNKYSVFAIIFIIIWSFLFILNIYTYSDFFKIPIYHLLNIFIAVAVAFFFAQMKSDERKLKDQLSLLVEKLQNTVVLEINKNTIESLSRPETLNICRRLNNIMQLLKANKKGFNIDKEIEYLEDQVSEFREEISERTASGNLSKDDYCCLLKYITNIDNRCDDISLKLFSD